MTSSYKSKIRVLYLEYLFCLFPVDAAECTCSVHAAELASFFVAAFFALVFERDGVSLNLREKKKQRPVLVSVKSLQIFMISYSVI